jgi:predicted metalloprotease with PDZ domain
MAVLLLLGAIGAVLLGAAIFAVSQSPVQEIEAMMMFLIGTVLFAAFAIIQALGKSEHLPYAAIRAAAAADFSAFVKGQGKVGISINSQDGRTIESVSANSAAAETGVMVGDRMIAIEGELCEGDYRAVVLRLVGAPGTLVSITVRRGEDRLDFNLTRR